MDVLQRLSGESIEAIRASVLVCKVCTTCVRASYTFGKRVFTRCSFLWVSMLLRVNLKYILSNTFLWSCSTVRLNKRFLSQNFLLLKICYLSELFSRVAH